MTLPEWPLRDVEGALEAIAPMRTPTLEAGAPTLKSATEIQTWVYTAATRRGLDATPLRLESDGVEHMLVQGAPCLVRSLGGLLAIRRASSSRVELAEKDGSTISAPMTAVVEHLLATWKRDYHLPTIDDVLAHARLPEARRLEARRRFHQYQLSNSTVNAGWSVRLSASAPITKQLLHAGQSSNHLRLIGSVVLVQLLTILSWYLLGQSALVGQVDGGRLMAWGLALASTVAVEVMGSRWQGLVSIGFTTVLKRRLMLGVLRIDPARLRNEGLGLSMGRVMACENMESLALSGGMMSALALIELVIALATMAMASLPLFAAFLALTVLILSLGALQLRATRAWVSARLTLTHELIEQMLGYRTRGLQGDPRVWHAEEDRLLAGYAESSQRFDRIAAIVRALVPRSSLILGLTFIVPIFVARAPLGVVSVALGAVLLTQRALNRLSTGLTALSSSAVAWERAGEVFEAAQHDDDPPTVEGLRAMSVELKPNEPLVTARNLDFEFDRGRRVLEGAELTVRVGDQLLLEGPSGSGKSTVASLLAGARHQSGGLLLLAGLDRSSLGRWGWRRRVVAAPQSHENHLLQGSLAFNLLFGRAWPPQRADLEAAKTICTELGLGPLLERMPEGLHQPVGSVGWRLSHGERSRVFIARALLQRSELVILDESFAALDPETVELTMERVRARSRSLVVVAHP